MPFRDLVRWCSLVGLWLALAPAWGADAIRVEEDWELIVARPNPADATPQITTTMAPLSNLANVRWLFTVNHESQPGVAAGGLEIQYWQGNSPRFVRRARSGVPLHVSGETITWTQVLSIDRGTLTFAVVDGSSQSWGDFGVDGSLVMSVTTGLRNLNAYRSDVSYYNSGVSGRVLAPTLVHSLVLHGVRIYSREGLISESTAPEVVYYH